MGMVRRALGDAAPTLVVAADVIYSPALATALVRVLAALLLIGGAVVLFRRGYRKQAGLMVVAALVALMNVAIWTIPDSSGVSPVDGVPAESGDGS